MRPVAIIGCGPAGLMAAEALARQGYAVHCFDAMPSAGRKFLMAGKSGLNLTHAEPFADFITRYGSAAAPLRAALEALPPAALRAWAGELGIATFIGSSGRVFPTGMKAAPLLRAWLHRLRQHGVRFHMRHRWTGWQDQALCFDTPDGPLRLTPAATLLALGGASWPQLGSDGAWAEVFAARGVPVSTLRPSNCGFDVGWSAHFAERHAGAPLKPVVAHWHGLDGVEHALQGECVATSTGVEGSVIYAISADLRETIARDGHAMLWLDLAPGRDVQRLARDLAAPRGKRSIGEFLRRQTGLDAVKAALVFEVLPREALDDAARVAATIKRLPLRLTAARPVAEAISSAGGVVLDALDDTLQLRALPGVFCAGEMLDWEAPTGGYLLTACYASGWVAGHGAAAAAHATINTAS